MSTETVPKKRKLSLDSLVNEPEPVPSRDDGVVETRASRTPSYREGKRAFTAWARIEAYKQLKRLATDRDTTVQALLEEGMDLVFEKYGSNQIARKP